MKRYIVTMMLISIMSICHFQQVKAQYESGTTDAGYDLNLYEMNLLSGNKVVDQGVLAVLLQNAPTHYQAPKLPRFAIIGKEHKFYLGMGGYVRGTISFDFGNPIKNPTYFVPSTISKVSEGNGGRTQMSMGTSNLFFNFVSLPGDANQIGAYIDFNFDKTNYGVDLRLAYITWRNFTMGYNYSIFNDQRCIIPTVDFEGAPSLSSVRTNMFIWEDQWHKWDVGIGIESPILSITNNDAAQMVNQRIPSMPMYAAYNWNEDSYTRLSGIFRVLQYRNELVNGNRARLGFGLQLTGIYAIHDMIDFYYQGIYGHGVADYIQDTYDLNLDMTPHNNKPGKLRCPDMFAFMGGFKINYTKRLHSGHMYSQVRNYAKQYSVTNPLIAQWDDQYKLGQYFCNNLFFSMGQLELGIEYIWGARKNMGGTFAHNNRLQMMAKISF